MRSVIGVFLAAAVGIHCSAPAEGSDTEASDIVATPTPSASPTPHHPSSNDVAAPAEKPFVPGFEALVHGGAPIVTSSVVDETGTSYITGTFVGTVAIGNTTIKSHGDKDVFLMKLAPSGAFQWVRAIGSGEDEMSPKLTLDGVKLTVVGITKGKMDCGSGPLQEWAGETFFVCTFGRSDGTPLSGGAFPTAF